MTHNLNSKYEYSFEVNRKWDTLLDPLFIDFTHFMLKWYTIFLKLLSDITQSYLDKSLSPCQRTYQMWFAVFVFAFEGGE